MAKDGRHAFKASATAVHAVAKEKAARGCEIPGRSTREAGDATHSSVDTFESVRVCRPRGGEAGGRSARPLMTPATRPRSGRGIFSEADDMPGWKKGCFCKLGATAREPVFHGKRVARCVIRTSSSSLSIRRLPPSPPRLGEVPGHAARHAVLGHDPRVRLVRLLAVHHQHAVVGQVQPEKRAGGFFDGALERF